MVHINETQPMLFVRRKIETRKKKGEKVSLEVTGVIKHSVTALPLHAFYTY